MIGILKDRVRLRKIAHELFILGLLVVGVLAARSTLADHYYVPSGSMEFTLVAGDRVFVDKRAFGLRIPFTNLAITDGDPVRRGDVVIFDSPRDGTRLIKRIVAVGGDRVQIRDGHLAINGNALALPGGPDEEVIGGKTVMLNLHDGGGPPLDVRIPQGRVLAIGDHRGDSIDGRFFGAVPEADVYGRAVAIYYRRDSGLGWHKL